MAMVGGEGEGVSTFILSTAVVDDVVGGAGHEVVELLCLSS